ncbi:hypothetical protein LTS17_005209 [Exophiala oligosperma]
MVSITCRLVVAISLWSPFTGAQVVIPAPNGTYTVALSILELKNPDSIQPYAPEVEVPALMLSVFYPTHDEETVKRPYMDTDTAIFEDLSQAQQSGLDSKPGTFQKLSMQLAANGSKVAQPEGDGGWPILVFGCALGTSRLFYSALLSQVASTGYVVVAYDTPYDTDIVVYPNGENITASETVTAALDTTNATAVEHFLIADVNVRAQDASFIVTSFNNNSFAASVIPGCSSCLNTTHVGYFGHSIGGSAGATLLLNDTRIAGAVNMDGAVTGHVVSQGLDRPFMLMAVSGQTRDGKLANVTNWAAFWSNLRGPSFDLIVNDAAHYTYSDLPLVLDLLGIFPTNETVLDSLELTSMNGTRAHHIVTTYIVTFFDWLLKNGSDYMLKNTNLDFPEVSLDLGDTEAFSNGTVIDVVNGTVISKPGSGSSGDENAATPTSTRSQSAWVVVFLIVLSLIFSE